MKVQRIIQNISSKNTAASTPWQPWWLQGLFSLRAISLHSISSHLSLVEACHSWTEASSPAVLNHAKLSLIHMIHPNIILYLYMTNRWWQKDAISSELGQQMRKPASGPLHEGNLLARATPQCVLVFCRMAQSMGPYSRAFLSVNMVLLGLKTVP